MTQIESPVLTSRKAAELLGCAEYTLRLSRTTGTLWGFPTPPFTKFGRSVRYKRNELNSWKKQYIDSQSYTSTKDYMDQAVSPVMPNVMIDLETMSTASNAAIVSIGAVEFEPDTNKLGRTFYRRVSLESSVEAGLDMQPSTVLWWMDKCRAARSEITSSDNLTLKQALREFTQWCPSNMTPWGNTASFDLTILTNAYRAIGQDKPWEYRNERCYRTLKALHPEIKLDRTGTHHNALDDAINQANHLMQIFKAMEERK